MIVIVPGWALFCAVGVAASVPLFDKHGRW